MSVATPRIRDEAPGNVGICFGRSADGYPVALVGETAFAMVPVRNGRHYLVMGWRIRRPMAEWTRSDFYGHAGELADEAAFRAHVEENALHQQHRVALGRREIDSRAHTPWGTSQGATVYAEGVVSHSTAGHGGFHLSAERNRKVHVMLRADGGWYEEDCHWAAVAQAFPQLLTDFEKACAKKTIRDWYPEAWEAIHGRVLEPGQSAKKDERDSSRCIPITGSWRRRYRAPGRFHRGYRDARRQAWTGHGGTSLSRSDRRIPCRPLWIRHRCCAPSCLWRAIELHGLAGEGHIMSVRDRRAQLFRMEEARRQTQRQLDMIDRQIIRRMTAIIPQLKPQRNGRRRLKPADARTFLERYRSNLAAITQERQHEIDAYLANWQGRTLRSQHCDRIPPDLRRA